MAHFAILGARGFVGSHLVGYLNRSGHQVRAFSRQEPAPCDQNLGHVIFCIGLTTDYAKRPLDTAEAHACALIPLLRDAQFDSLIYLSSIRLYDGLADVAHEASELRLDPRNPRHLYDFSKGLGEALAHHGGRTARVARLANVYSDELDQEDFLCHVIRRARIESAFELDADPDGGRDYIHIDDVCKALEAIALSGRKPVYNVATGSIFTNRELALQCARELNCHVNFRRPNTVSPSPRVEIAELDREFEMRPLPASRRLPAILRALRDKRSRP